MILISGKNKIGLRGVYVFCLQSFRFVSGEIFNYMCDFCRTMENKQIMYDVPVILQFLTQLFSIL